MAHVHGTNKTEMASGMMKGMMGSEMMKGMMEPGKMGMGSEMMKGMMGPGMGKEAVRTAKIVVVSGGARARHGILGRLIRHPAVLLGLGVATGVLIYKYRKDIISAKDE